MKIVDTKNIGQSSKSWDVEEIGEDDFSYLIFTSGSTGKPKGVPIRHRNLNTFFQYFLTSKKYHFTSSDRFLQAFELTFDPSVMALFLPLSIWACCYVVP